MKKISLAIDNGNKQTKSSQGFICESGYTMSDVEPIVKSQLLILKEKYYSIGNNRLSVQMDKTINDDAFILTLPAIAHAIKEAGIDNDSIVDVNLGVGLPIVHYGKLKGKFREYFIRDGIEFIYEGRTYNINISEAKVYPQGYGAYITVFQDYRNVGVANIIDIGGLTVDLFCVENGIINTRTCFSLPCGIITLLTSIQQELLKSNINLTERQIQDIIVGKEPVLFDLDVKQIIEEKAKKYTEDLISKIVELGFELRNPNILIGGGSMLLKRYIEEIGKVKYAEYLDNFANARGFKTLLEREIGTR